MTVGAKCDAVITSKETEDITPRSRDNMVSVGSYEITPLTPVFVPVVNVRFPLIQ